MFHPVLIGVSVSFQFTLGGFEELQEMKVRGRERFNLPPLPEDSIKVVRAMRAASPPASAMELIEQQQQQKRGRRSRRVLTPPSPTHPSTSHTNTFRVHHLCDIDKICFFFSHSRTSYFISCLILFTKQFLVKGFDVFSVFL